MTIKPYLVVGSAFALALAPSVAFAHVPVTPNTASPGTKVQLTFTVPNESATAGTVKVEIDLPTSTPFGAVDYQPVAGWTASVKMGKLSVPIKNDGATITEAPSAITFVAHKGVEISDGQVQQFILSVDPVPDTASVIMPVHQTYSDGSVVDWIDPTPASGEEPEHPAPTLYVNDAPPSTDSKVSPTVSASSTQANSTDSTLSLTLGTLGLAFGLGGFVLGVVGMRRRSN